MSIEMTLSFVRAAVQRAEHQGHVNVELNVKDMLEILPLMERGLHHQRADKPMKRAGWASPESMRDLLGGKRGKRSMRIIRHKTETHNLEVFFCDSIKEKQIESAELVLAKAMRAAKAEVAE